MKWTVRKRCYNSLSICWTVINVIMCVCVCDTEQTFGLPAKCIRCCCCYFFCSSAHPLAIRTPHLNQWLEFLSVLSPCVVSGYRVSLGCTDVVVRTKLNLTFYYSFHFMWTYTHVFVWPSKRKWYNFNQISLLSIFFDSINCRYIVRWLLVCSFESFHFFFRLLFIYRNGSDITRFSQWLLTCFSYLSLISVWHRWTLALCYTDNILIVANKHWTVHT